MIQPLCIAAQVLQDDRIGPPLADHADRPVKEPEDDLRVCPAVKDDAHPVLSLHAKGPGQPWDPDSGQALLPAFDVAVLQLRSAVPVPLAHEQGGPLTGLRLRQNREAREIGPLVLFLYIMFFPGISR